MPVLTKQQTTARIPAYEQTPVSFVLKQSAYLWAVPIVLMCAWLSIPLSIDGGQTTHMGLFLVWRALYHQSTCGFVISLTCIAMPTPSFVSQIAICAVAVGSSLLVDYAFTMEADYMLRAQLFKLVPLFAMLMVLPGLYLATRAAFARELKIYLSATSEDRSIAQLPALRPSFLAFEESEQAKEEDLTPKSQPGALSRTISNLKSGVSFRNLRDRTAASDSAAQIAEGSNNDDSAINNDSSSSNHNGNSNSNNNNSSSSSSEIGTTNSAVNSTLTLREASTARIDVAPVYTAERAENVGKRAIECDVSICRRDKNGELFLVYSSQDDLNKAWLWRLIYFIPIFALYCLCVYYGPLTKSVLVDDYGAALTVLLFVATLFPLRFILNNIGKRIDATLDRVEGLPKFTHVGIWTCLCFEQFFVRQLFFRISQPQVVTLVVGINLLKLYMLFPMRMSDRFLNFKSWVLKKDPMTDEEKYKLRSTETVTFYFVCMAERMSITIVMLCVSMVYFCTYNAMFFSDSTTTASYETFVGTCFQMLGIEWTGSTIMTIILIKLYKLNALTFGGHVMVNPHVKVCCIYIAVNIASDYYAATCMTRPFW